MATTVIEVADLAKCLHEDLGLGVVCSNFYGRPMHRIVVLGPNNDFDVLIDDASIEAADSDDHTEVLDSIPRGSDLYTILGFVAEHLGVDLAKPMEGEGE